MPANRPPLLRNAVLAMVNRTVGVATDEVHGLTVRQVGRAIERLLLEGLAFRARYTGKDVRYFSSQALADAYIEDRRLQDATEKENRARVAAFNPASADAVANWDRNAKINYPVDHHGCPTWKLTVCPPSPIGLTRTNTFTDSH